MSKRTKYVEARETWGRRVVEYLWRAKCECRYLGDGEMLKCGRCVFLVGAPEGAVYQQQLALVADLRAQLAAAHAEMVKWRQAHDNMRQTEPHTTIWGLTQRAENAEAQLAAAQARAAEDVSCMEAEHGGHPTCPHTEEMLQGLRDALAAAQIREGQLREALHNLYYYDGETANEAAYALLSSPPDAPDVLGAIRVLAKFVDECCRPFADDEPEVAALATLRAAGIVE